MSLGSILRVKSRSCNLALLLVGVLSFVVASQTTARIVPIDDPTPIGSDSTLRLQNAVHRLNAWLVEAGRVDEFRRPLMFNVLETQSARGERADIGTLQQIHDRFGGGFAIPDVAAFRDVQIALHRQIQHLRASRIGDLFATMTLARGQYRPISIEAMAAQRDTAKQALNTLKEYYRTTVPKEDLAELFSDLQLDQAIQHLDEIQFELAPEESVGKMTSMIRGVESQLNEVVRKIDAIPLPPETDEEDDGEDEKTADQKQEAQDREQRLAELTKEREQIEARINELKQKRREISNQDKPRQDKRRATFLTLRKFEDNFILHSETQGDPYFVSALQSYTRFFRTYSYGTADNLEEQYVKRLERFEADLLVIDGPNQREFAGKVGDHLSWMEDTNQIPELVTAVRAKYSMPNLYASVSGKLLNRIAGQSLNETQSLCEMIDGRLVRGTLTTNGQVDVDLQNDPNQVHASIHLLGNMNSSTYVDQGKVRAFISTSGQLEGRRSIYGNVGGLFAGTPKVAANIRACFNGTSCRLRVVDRIAAKKFEEVRYKTESGAARRAEDELIKRFGQQTDEPIVEGKTALADAQVKIIPKTILLPEVYVRSFTSEIMAIGKLASISTLAAQTMPTNHAIPLDVAVRVHDSMPTNFLDKMFSGKTFTNEELATELGDLLGEAPETLIDKPDSGKDESFSITFATIRPIQLEFEDNGVRIVVSGRRFAQGNNAINEGLKIILRFKIIRIDGQLKFVRDGKALIDYLPDEKKRPATVAFRSFLDGKLNPKDGAEEVAADLPENLLPIDDMEIFQDGKMDGKIARQMRLVQCRSENGWIYLGWNYQGEFENTSWVYDTPAIWDVTSLDEIYPKNDAENATQEDPLPDAVESVEEN